MLASSIAGELNIPFFKVSGPDLIGGTSGESEQRIRDLFSAAIDAAPSVLFIDSIDVIASKKDVHILRHFASFKSFDVLLLLLRL